MIIGIDAGGTKTTGIILNQEKTVLFEVNEGAGNVTVSFNQGADMIETVLAKCLLSEYGRQCKYIVAGVAGIEAGDNYAKLLKRLSEMTSLPTILVNDAMLAYYSVFEVESGILTISGTGSISIGIDQGKINYMGGWGHLLGDEGSSYDVAINACKRIANELELEVELQALTTKLMKFLKVEDSSGLKKFVYQSTRNQIAAITQFIYLQANNGDQQAIALFEHAGEDLAAQTIRLIRKMELTNQNIACKGSLLVNNSFVLNTFRNKLLREYPKANITVSKSSAAIGASVIVEKFLRTREQDEINGHQ